MSILETFNRMRVHFGQGDMYDHDSLVKAIKQVDVVISTVGNFQLADQVKIIAAIKEAGNVKVRLSYLFLVLFLPPRVEKTEIFETVFNVFRNETFRGSFSETEYPT